MVWRRLAVGIDPSAERLAAKMAAADTFEAIGREWLKVQESKLSAAPLGPRAPPQGLLF